MVVCRVAKVPSWLPRLSALCFPGPRDDPGIYVHCACFVSGRPGYSRAQGELPVEIRIVLPRLNVPFIYQRNKSVAGSRNKGRASSSLAVYE